MQTHVAFNNLDLIVICIILLSGLFALMRGFVREALSLASWIGAYYVAAKYYALAIPFLPTSIKNPPTMTMAAAALVFVVTLIIFTLISYLISRLIRGQALTAIDRSLGFIFGVMRGVLFVGIMFLVAQTILWPSLETIDPRAEQKFDPSVQTLQDAEKKENVPQWIVKARTFEAMRFTALTLKSFLPQKELNKFNKHLGDQKASTQKFIDDKALEILSTPTPSAKPDAVPQPGYNDATRSDMNNKVTQ